jgi:hypothetical protein
VVAGVKGAQNVRLDTTGLNKLDLFKRKNDLPGILNFLEKRRTSPLSNPTMYAHMHCFELSQR